MSHLLAVVGVLGVEVGHQLLVLLLLAVLRCQFLHHGQKLLLLHQLRDAYRQDALHGIVAATLLVQVVHRQPSLLQTFPYDEARALRRLHRHSGCRRLCCVVGRCSSRCAWFRLRLSKRTTIHIQAAYQESFATLLNLLVRQRFEPSGRAVHLVACHQYKALWGEALRVGLHLQVVVAVVVQIGTELSLRLLDGLALGHQNPDVALGLARGILDVEYGAVPLRHLVLVHGQCAADGLRSLLGVVDVGAGLACEHLGQNVLLGTMVIAEGRVVRTDVGQSPQFFVLIEVSAQFVAGIGQLCALQHVHHLLSRCRLSQVQCVVLVQHFPRRSVFRAGVN